MRASVPYRALAATAFLSLFAIGCQDPDVGQPCQLDFVGPDGGTVIDPATAAGDFLETGKPECENLVCVLSAKSKGSKAGANPYCSKPCVSDQDCFSSDTGLICRQIVLDPDFIKALSPEVRQKYLGDITFSNYCAVPATQQ
jgi:hypothetical protein